MGHLQLHNLDVYQKLYNRKKIFTSYKNYLVLLRMSVFLFGISIPDLRRSFSATKITLYEVSHLKKITEFSIETKTEIYVLTCKL